MEYVYGAMLLHSAGQKVNEANVKKVLTAGGVEVDAGRVKALIASLDGVDIEDAIKIAAPVAAAPAAASAAAPEAGAKEKPKEEKKDEGKSEEEAASGLASLFG